MNRRLLITITLLCACAHAPNPMPEWARSGTGAFEAPVRCLRGVGWASKLSSAELRSSTAQVLARASVAKLLDVVSAALLDKSSAPGGEDALADAVHAFVASQFKQTRIADIWVSSDDVTYVRAELDFDPLRAALVKWTEADPAHRKGLAERLDSIFEQLAQKTRLHADDQRKSPQT